MVEPPLNGVVHESVAVVPVREDTTRDTGADGAFDSTMTVLCAVPLFPAASVAEYVSV